MKFYIVQMKVLQNGLEENFNSIKAAVARAKKAKADVVVFPPHALDGDFAMSNVFDDFFQSRKSAFQKKILALSKDIDIVFGMPSRIQYREACLVGVSAYCSKGRVADWKGKVAQFYAPPFGMKNKFSTDDDSRRFAASLSKKQRIPCIVPCSVGTCNSGKIIYALGNGTAVFDSKGKAVIEFPMFEEAEALVEIDSKGNVKTDFVSVPRKKGIALIHDALVYMIRENLRKFHIGRIVIGASGGIDSAVSAVLYSEAIGAENVYLVNMPTRFNSDTTKNAAKDLAANLGCPYMVAPISDMLKSVKGSLEKCKFVRSDKKIKVEDINYENLQARTRSASVLVTIASVLGAGVTCNGNKSEATTGYCTLYGDTCGVMCALGDLWKMQVYELARYINRDKEIIPVASIEIPASAELSDAMKVDEGKGDPIKYPYHDRLFAYWVEGNANIAETEKLLAKGSLCKKIGADPKYFKSLFKTNEEALADMRYWYRRYKGIALAKRLQFPPILGVSGKAFGELVPEVQG